MTSIWSFATGDQELRRASPLLARSKTHMGRCPSSGGNAMKTTLSLLTATALVLGCISTGSVAASKGQAAGANKAARLLTNCGQLPLIEVALSGVTQNLDTATSPTDVNGSD